MLSMFSVAVFCDSMFAAPRFGDELLGVPKAAFCS
jgi:hypothetical protein